MNTLKARKINDNLFYIGADDRDLPIFEGMLAIPKGVSYNSYLITGSSNICMDLTKNTVSKDFLDKIKSVIGSNPVDYLVINHIEPDHSSGIVEFMARYPNVKIICNKKTTKLLDRYYDVKSNIIEVTDGETLELGDHKLTFFMTPMVHWPESMVAYCPDNKILFSQDIFGSFGALNGSVFDDEIDFDKDYLRETQRYFINIVGKYAKCAIDAVGKLNGIEIDMICPVHGVVWRKDPGKIIDTYVKLATQETLNELLIIYGSMYGNTKKMAELIAEGASQAGIKTVKIRDISFSDVSELVTDCWLSKGIVLGAPTFDSSIFPPMANLLEHLRHQNMKNNLWTYFSNYSWNGGADKVFKEFMDCIDANLVTDPIKLIGFPKEDESEALRDMGRKMAEAILGKKEDCNCSCCCNSGCKNVPGELSESILNKDHYELVKKFLSETVK